MNGLFNDADIQRIAIIDDDLSSIISLSDLVKVDNGNGIADILSDKTDPSHIEYLKQLTAQSLPHNSPEEMASNLSDENVRAKAPEELRSLANLILQNRNDAAEPVHKIEQWVIDMGFDAGSIKKFHTPEDLLKENEAFDLVFVDYLLVDDSEDATIKLISKLLERNRTEEKTLLFILMSSHEDNLRKDFLTLRSSLEATSSRFRILKKPENNGIDKIKWMHTIEQLCKERALVPKLESFIQEWGDKFTKAVSVLASGLWTLDAHGIDILRRTAVDDHVEFPEYFAEVIMRRVLAEIEHDSIPSKISMDLSQSLEEMSQNEGVSPGAEVGDSREALRRLITDVSWHRENWYNSSNYPVFNESNSQDKKQHNIAQFNWVKKNIRFGTVIRNNRSGELLLNVTQPCDIAHLSVDDQENNHMLFFPGELASSDSAAKSKEVLSPALNIDEQWTNVHWQLSRPHSSPISEVMKDFESMHIAGQLRYDQTQQVIANYASQISRVGTLRIPQFTKLKGLLVKLVKENDTLKWELKSDTYFFAHLLNNTVNFEASDAHLLASSIEKDVIANENILLEKLVRGIKLDGDLKANVISTVKKASKDFMILNFLDLDSMFSDFEKCTSSMPALTSIMKNEKNGNRYFVILKRI
jgi:hypothetical protein